METQPSPKQARGKGKKGQRKGMCLEDRPLLDVSQDQDLNKSVKF